MVEGEEKDRHGDVEDEDVRDDHPENPADVTDVVDHKVQSRI